MSVTREAPTASDRVDAMVVSIAAIGLPNQGTFSREPLDDDSWDRLLKLVAIQNLDGLLNRGLREQLIAASDAQRHAASALHRVTMVRTLSLENLLLQVVGLLEGAHIPYRVLKGPALAHTVYRDPSMRSFCDVDILVPGDSFDLAAGMIAATGATRRYAEPRPGFDRRFSKGASFVTPQGLAIDLHRTFVVGPFGLSVDVDRLFADSRAFMLSGRTLETLPLEETFVHVCLHTALGDWPPRLTPMRDVAQLALLPEVDRSRVQSLARSWRATAPMAWSINHVWYSFNLPAHPLAAWAAEYVPSRREQQELGLYMSTERSYTNMALASTRAVPGIAPKLAYVRALALPDREYVADREHTYMKRWGHATRLMVGQGRTRRTDRATNQRRGKSPLRVRAYFSINRNLDRALRGVKGAADGACLGLLSRQTLHRIDQEYYDRRPAYVADGYNNSGLAAWERDAVKNHFPSVGRVVVTGAGAGREVIALQELGYDVVGYEPNEQLVEAGARLIERAGCGGTIVQSARDGWPDGERKWDAAVVGWGSYMLIQGRAARVEFLRQARAHLQPGGPVLLSFYCRPADTVYFRSVEKVGNALRRLLRRAPLELGDALAPNYVHYFSEKDIRRELHEAGFDVALFSTEEYGHAVGIAREASLTEGGRHG